MKRNINIIVVMNHNRVDKPENEKLLRGCAGMTVNGDFTSDVIINLHGVWTASLMCHRSIEEEFIRTMEHELAHAIGADDDMRWEREINRWIENEAERVSRTFEKAGGWARK